MAAWQLRRRPHVDSQGSQRRQAGAAFSSRRALVSLVAVSCCLPPCADVSAVPRLPTNPSNLCMYYIIGTAVTAHTRDHGEAPAVVARFDRNSWHQQKLPYWHSSSDADVPTR